MKRILASCLVAYSCSYCFAQTVDNKKPFCTILSNGTAVTFVYKESEKVLDVNVHNNESEVEIFAIKHGVIVDSESTSDMNDDISIDLSDYNNETLDVYVKTENEIQHIGSVTTEIKSEEENK